ncbi:MAG: hypothetical protein J5I47_06520 [Vicingus serpentipes]|nr:hypothetical protein [Vicingus serpentipes]
MRIILKIIVLLFLSSSFAYSQKNDSLVVNNSKYDSLLFSDAYFLDVLFYKHQNDVLINNLGPFGSTYYYPTTGGIYLEKKLLIINNNSFQSKLAKLEGIKPFTNITYINASRKEQLFSVSHVQQFGKLLSFAFNYKRISSPGSYINQEANNTLFDAVIDYKSKSDIYSFNFSTVVNRFFLDENGGLKNNSDFENNLFANRRTYDVNLLTSKVSKKNYSYFLKQKVRLWAGKEDSISYSVLDLKLNTGYSIRKRVFNDNDPLSAVYNNIFIDSLSSIDSIYQNTLSNQLSIEFSKNNTAIGFYGFHEFENYAQNFGIDTSYQNVYVGSFLTSSLNKFNVDVDARYAFFGYRKGDFDVDLNFDYNLNKDYQIRAEVAYHLNEPSLNYINYTSNHFFWRNYDFKKTSILSSIASVEFKKIKTQLLFENKLLNNLLYFNTEAEVAQLSSIHSFSSFSISKNYQIFNFYFRSAVIYQTTTNDFLFPLPDFIGRQIIYYQDYLFKKALKFQLGFNVSYSTNYYGYAYMPATSQFYIQSDKKIGDYPYFDVFFNTQLKRAQIFFKYEHFNAGWSGYNYYSVTGYPVLDRSFKFGVSWNMFD